MKQFLPLLVLLLIPFISACSDEAKTESSTTPGDISVVTTTAWNQQNTRSTSFHNSTTTTGTETTTTTGTETTTTTVPTTELPDNVTGISDNTPPVLESFEFLENGQEFRVGDTAHVRIKATDDSGIDVGRTYPVVYNGRHHIHFKMSYNQSTGYLEGSYTFTKEDVNGKYTLSYIPCYDIYGNYYHGVLPNESQYYISLVEGGVSDNTPPVLESFEFLENGQEFRVGDTAHVRIKVTDDSGIDVGRTYPVVYNGSHHIHFKMSYNQSTGYLEGSYTFTKEDVNGKYTLSYIPCYDIYGNYYHGVLPNESQYYIVFK